MRISVAICTYNGEKFIREQLESILSQTHPVDEIVLCDDQSTDLTVVIAESVLSSFQGDSLIIVNDKALNVARNFQKAYDLCTGDIIFSCDQDDVWLPNKVEVMLEEMENEAVVLSFTDAIVVDEVLHETGSLWETVGVSYEQINTTQNYYDRLMKSCIVTGATMAFKRSLWEICRPIEAPCIQDMWISFIAPFYGDVVAIPKKTILYRRHSNTVTPVGRKQYQNSQNRKRRSKKITVLKNMAVTTNQDWFFSEYYRMDAVVKRFSSEKHTLYFNKLMDALQTHHIIQKCAELKSPIKKVYLLSILLIEKKYTKYRGNIRRFCADIIYSILYGWKSEEKTV